MQFVIDYRCCRCRNRMVFGFTSTIQSVRITTKSREFTDSRSWRGVFDKTLGDNVCQLLATGRWFSPDTLVSATD